MKDFQGGLPDAEDAEISQRSQKGDPIENDFSHEIIGAAVEVQRVLGVGLLGKRICRSHADRACRTGTGLRPRGADLHKLQG